MFYFLLMCFVLKQCNRIFNIIFFIIFCSISFILEDKSIQSMYKSLFTLSPPTFWHPLIWHVFIQLYLHCHLLTLNLLSIAYTIFIITIIFFLYTTNTILSLVNLIVLNETRFLKKNLSSNFLVYLFKLGC